MSIVFDLSKTAAPTMKSNAFQSALSKLRAAVHGSAAVLEEGADGYKDALVYFNGMFNDRRPALIVRCKKESDVIATIAFSRESGLPLAVRSGGHSFSGKSSIDGGVLLDLSLMKAIQVDVKEKKAHAESGVLWRDYIGATYEQGFGTPGAVISDTGIAGVALGGGWGWLSREHGLACDHLLEARCVTADGTVLIVNKDSHPELFWAIRGGGGQFGVVTLFTFALVPIAPVWYAGVMFFPIDRAVEVIETYNTWLLSGVSRKCSSWPLLGRLPPSAPGERATDVCGMLLAYHGPEQEALKEAKVIFDLQPMVNMCKPMNYLEVNTFLDPLYPPGARLYVKSGYFKEGISKEVVETLVTLVKGAPQFDMIGVNLEMYNGAVADVDISATAFPHRSSGPLSELSTCMIAVAGWRPKGDEDPALLARRDEESTTWVRGVYNQLVAKGLSTTAYINFDAHGDKTAADVYGPNEARLTRVKELYDPSHFFDHSGPTLKAKEGS
mmetsp:Transcript_14378/g.23743  ORF Transcript_14378/g.23743 Transcript_14378/m.23743 type:complete len:498 (-) Transcript_14378:773-2266(-)